MEHFSHVDVVVWENQCTKTNGCPLLKLVNVFDGAEITWVFDVKSKLVVIMPYNLSKNLLP